MAIPEVSSTNSSSGNYQEYQNRVNDFHARFERIGKSLESGDLLKASTDFVTLTGIVDQDSDLPYSPIASSAASWQSTSPKFAAEAPLTDDRTSSAPPWQPHPADRARVAKAFQAFNEALQSGSVLAAQEAYYALQRDLQQFARANGLNID